MNEHRQTADKIEIERTIRAKQPTTEQSSTKPLQRAERALCGDSNDEEHDALFYMVEAYKAQQNHAGKLAEALRDIRDCAFDPWQIAGVEAGKSNTIAISAFAARVYSVAKAALAAYEEARQ